jgi:hypothetical protein
MHHVTEADVFPYVDDRERDIDREIDVILSPSRWRRFLNWLIGLICP